MSQISLAALAQRRPSVDLVRCGLAPLA